MLEILLEPNLTTNLDFFPGSLLPGSRSCVPSSLIVFDLPALPRDPSGSSDHIAFLCSRTASDSHLSSPGRIHPRLNCELSPLNCFFFLPWPPLTVCRFLFSLTSGHATL
ncbi:hypothetical protein ILYODFUR_015507 [Ilyodon furcidens]|uniref:Uncharacterized protein n=1 Tax=Ilyodon furcidens TaxID=33524 RepID=A0ABV0UI87_9TELE